MPALYLDLPSLACLHSSVFSVMDQLSKQALVFTSDAVNASSDALYLQLQLPITTWKAPPASVQVDSDTLSAVGPFQFAFASSVTI